MTHWHLLLIGGAIATIHLVILLLLYPRVSPSVATLSEAVASAERAEILHNVQSNQADVAATSAFLATLAQLIANSRAETNAERLTRIEACVCPTVRAGTP